MTQRALASEAELVQVRQHVKQLQRELNKRDAAAIAAATAKAVAEPPPPPPPQQQQEPQQPQEPQPPYYDGEEEGEEDAYQLQQLQQLLPPVKNGDSMRAMATVYNGLAKELMCVTDNLLFSAVVPIAISLVRTMEQIWYSYNEQLLELDAARHLQRIAECCGSSEDLLREAQHILRALGIIFHLDQICNHPIAVSHPQSEHAQLANSARTVTRWCSQLASRSTQVEIARRVEQNYQGDNELHDRRRIVRDLLPLTADALREEFGSAHVSKISIENVFRRCFGAHRGGFLFKMRKYDIDAIFVYKPMSPYAGIEYVSGVLMDVGIGGRILGGRVGLDASPGMAHVPSCTVIGHKRAFWCMNVHEWSNFMHLYVPACTAKDFIHVQEGTIMD